MPASYRSVAEPHHQGLVLHGAGEHAGVSIGIFVNNIQVTFLAFAGGITLGLLTRYVLVTNGILLGARRGLATSAGNGGDLLRLVVGARRARALAASPSRRRPGCASAGRSSSPGRGDARDGAAQPRPRGRSRSCSARCRGSCSRGSSKASSPAATRLAVVLPLGFALGALYWGLVVWRARSTPRAGARLGPQVRADAGAGEAVGRRLDDGCARGAARAAAAGARAREHVERDAASRRRRGARPDGA